MPFAAQAMVREAQAAYGRKAPLELLYGHESKGVWIYKGDSLVLLEQIHRKYPRGLFDLIFADPPYFLSNGGITCHAGRMVSVDKGDWDKISGVEAMHEFNRKWLSACQKVLKPNGTIFVSGTAHVIHSVGFAMQELGYKLLNDIIWVKPNPPPNLSCRYFTHATETIIWAAKNKKSKHKFDYEVMEERACRQHLQGAWPRVARDEDRQIIIKVLPPRREEKKYGKHPTQKPVALLERLILAASDEGDFVLDPFLGSGTTAVAALRLRRRCVGCELDEKYVRSAISRVADEVEKPRQRVFA